MPTHKNINISKYMETNVDDIKVITTSKPHMITM